MAITMRKLPVAAVILLLTWVVAPAVKADTVAEAEANGTAVNNTLSTAQAIPASSFTLPVPYGVFSESDSPTATILGHGGGDDVDFFSFRVLGGAVFFDIDNDPFTFNTVLSLFDSGGTLLVLADDSSPVDIGSASTLDSFLGVYALPGPGTYYVAVSKYSNLPNAFPCPGIALLNRPDGESSGGYALSGCAAANFSFTASGIQEGGAYRLQLSVDQPGIVAVPPDTPTSFLLGRVHPNPTRVGATISFTLPVKTDVLVEVCDVAGCVVRVVLPEQELPSGTRSLFWDGRDDSGRIVASGLYFLRTRVGSASVVRRLAVLR